MPEQATVQKEKVVLYTPTGRGEGYRLDSPTGQSIDKVTVQRWQTPGNREYRPNIEIEIRQNPATTYTGGETRTEREFAQKQTEVMRKETEAAAPALYRVEAGGRVYETPSPEFAERKLRGEPQRLREEYIRSLLERQGKHITQREGVIEAVAGGRREVIETTPKRTYVSNLPSSAAYSPGFVAGIEAQAVRAQEKIKQDALIKAREEANVARAGEKLNVLATPVTLRGEEKIRSALLAQESQYGGVTPGGLFSAQQNPYQRAVLAYRRPTKTIPEKLEKVKAGVQRVGIAFGEAVSSFFSSRKEIATAAGIGAASKYIPGVGLATTVYFGARAIPKIQQAIMEDPFQASGQLIGSVLSFGLISGTAYRITPKIRFSAEAIPEPTVERLGEPGLSVQIFRRPKDYGVYELVPSRYEWLSKKGAPLVRVDVIRYAPLKIIPNRLQLETTPVIRPEPYGYTKAFEEAFKRKIAEGIRKSVYGSFIIVERTGGTFQPAKMSQPEKPSAPKGFRYVEKSDTLTGQVQLQLLKVETKQKQRPLVVQVQKQQQMQRQQQRQRQESASSLLQKPLMLTLLLSKQKPALQSVLGLNSLQKTEQIQEQEQEQKQKLISLQILESKAAQKAITAQKAIQIQKQVPIQEQKLKLEQVQELKQELKLKQKLKADLSQIQRKKDRLLSPSKKEGYALLLKRFGRYKRYPGVFTKEAALDIGARTTAQTLGATFQIKKTSQTPQTTRGTGDFARLRRLFREYAVRRGIRMPLQGTYIQKRSTRLGRRQEVAEIQAEKRKRSAIKMQTLQFGGGLNIKRGTRTGSVFGIREPRRKGVAMF